MGLKGYRLWAMGQLDSTCKDPSCAPPCRAVIVVRPALPDDALSGGGTEAPAGLPGGRVRMVALTPGGCQIGGHVRPELDLWVALTPGGVSDWLHVRPELDLWVALTPGCQMGCMDHGGYHQSVF
jgi:hypothetical protein